MWRAWFLVSTVFAQELCLQDAIPAADLLWVKDDTGREIPIGLFEAEWDSNYLFTQITQILIEEVVGYHTIIGAEAGGNGAAAHFALAGCQRQSEDLQCDQETRLHIHVDSWMSNWQAEEQQIKDAYPHLQALDLGSMGYSGIEGFYVTKSTFKMAYDLEGLALNFFLSYNRSHHNVRQYFDGIADVNTELLNLCEDTDFFNTEHMQNYLLWTDDQAGLVQQDGGHVAKCLDGYFWLAPACRDDPPSCILALTAVTGWAMQSFMQWATAYGIPAALGVAKTFENEVEIVKDLRCLFYWYEPDVAFVQMEPSQLILPAYSAQEWANGERKTASPSTYVNKACSANLPLKAPKVSEFVSKLSFGLRETQRMLAEIAAGVSLRETACNWVRRNRERWGAWSAAVSRCPVGFGQADSAGDYIAMRDEKSTCKQCSPGRFAERTADSLGTFFRCSLCEPGYFQSKSGATLCEPCAPGTYDNSSGTTSCTVCEIGFYQSKEATDSCEACPAERTTLLLAAKSRDDCVCKAGSIEDGDCVQCSEGLACPRGSTVQLLLEGKEDDDVPKVEEGYFSAIESPLEIYRCSSYCPGGRPGTCLAGRIGVTCGECPWRTFIQQDECRPCHDIVRVLWFLAAPTVLIAVFSSFYTINKPHPVKATAMTCIFACVGLLIVFCEIMAVVQSVAVQWPKSLELGLKVFEIFGLNLDSIGFGCVAGTRVKSYRVESLFIPMVASAALVMFLLTTLLPKRCKSWVWDLPGTLNMLGHFLQEGFTTMSQIVTIPFSCFSHPSGKRSLLTAPNVICGSEDHESMQFYGGILGLFTMCFLAACCYAAWKAPAWSSMPLRMRCIRFLIERFRPDVWWYGTVLLVRGPLLTMPAIVAANVPGLQMTGILGIMLISVLIQVRVLPWNAPLVNAADALSSSFLLILLAIGLARLEPGGDWATGVLDIAGIVVASLMAAVWTAVMGAVVVLLCRKTLLGREDSRIINLKRLESPSDIVVILNEISRGMLAHESDKAAFDEQLSKVLAQLSVYDFQQLCTVLVLLHDDLGVGSGRRVQSVLALESTRVRHNTAVHVQAQAIRASRSIPPIGSISNTLDTADDMSAECQQESIERTVSDLDIMKVDSPKDPDPEGSECDLVKTEC